jgi:hypothetical protein
MQRDVIRLGRILLRRERVLEHAPREPGVRLDEAVLRDGRAVVEAERQLVEPVVDADVRPAAVTRISRQRAEADVLERIAMERLGR